MTIKNLIAMLCDGDNNKHRDKVSIKAINDWYVSNTQKEITIDK